MQQKVCGSVPLIVLVMAAAAVVASSISLPIAGAQTPIFAANRTAPSFSRHAIDKKNVDLTAYRGKVVVLNFWATWCAPCRSEVPNFVAWQRKYARQGLQVIGISMDDDQAPVRAAYRKYAMNYPVVMGDEKLGELYGGILSLPVTFLIDRDGKIRFEHQGAVDPDIIDREIQKLLPEH